MANKKTSAEKTRARASGAKKKREREAAKKKREREAAKKKRLREAAKKKRLREAAKKKRLREAANWKKRLREAAKTAEASERRPRQPKRTSPAPRRSRADRASAQAPTPTPAMTTPPRAMTTLEIVRDGIRRAGQARGYGGGKAFVSSVYDAVRAQIDMTLPQFKRWLVRANQQGDLILARADLRAVESPDSPGSDPNVLRNSEIEDMGSTFHFVMAPPERPEDLRQEAKQMVAVQRAEDLLSR